MIVEVHALILSLILTFIVGLWLGVREGCKLTFKRIYESDEFYLVPRKGK